MRELRYALSVFERYRDVRKVTMRCAESVLSLTCRPWLPRWLSPTGPDGVQSPAYEGSLLAL